jgi:hypothetical protein
MASSSSISSNSPLSSFIISITSPDSETSKEATPEFDPIASYEDLAPLHWDAEEWDYSTCSEDDEPLTDDEDLQILLHGALDEDDYDSWDGDFFSSLEKDTQITSSDDDSTTGGYLHGGSSTSEDGEDSRDDASHSSDDGDDSSSTGGGNGNSDDDTSIPPPYKRRKTLGSYWW